MPQTTLLTAEQWAALPDPAKKTYFLPPPVSARKVRLFGCLCLQRCRDWLSPEGRDALDVAERFAHGLATGAERQAAFRRLVEGCGGYVGPHPVGRPWTTATMPNDLVARAVALVIATAEETLFNAENGLPFGESYEDVKFARRVAESCQVAAWLVEDMTQAHADSARTAAGRRWARLVRAVATRLGSDGRNTPTNIQIRKQEAEYQSVILHEIFGNPYSPVDFSPDWRTDTAVLLAKQMYESDEFSAMPILADALQDAGCDSEDVLTHCRDVVAKHIRGCWVVDLVLGKQ